jgi:hypothetical protein
MADRERPAYLYRLVVEYPPEAFNGGSPAFYDDGTPKLDPNWEPEGWDGDTGYYGPDFDGFRWPDARRRFLSHTSAVNRANLLRKYGATVDIERSDRVTWPTQEQASEQEGE